VEDYIKKGAWVTYKNEKEEVALIISCEKGNLDIIDFLIKNNPDVNMNNSIGNSPLIILCKRKFEDTLKSTLDKLIEKGAKINFKGEFGITPLMMACYFNNTELVKYLIEKKADLNITNEDNDTPLIIATYFNNETIVNILLNNESKNITNIYSETALMIADDMNNEKIKEKLKKHYSGITL